VTAGGAERKEWATPDAVGIVGGLLCVLMLLLIAFVGRTKNVELAAYLFLFFAAPVIAAVSAGFGAQRVSLVLPIMLGKTFLAAVLIIVSAMVVYKLPNLQALPGRRVLSVAVLGALACSVLLALLARRRTIPPQALDLVLAVALTGVLVLFSPLDTTLPLASTMIGYIRDTPRFGLFIAAGVTYVALALLAGFWEGRTSAGSARTWLVRLALLLGLALALSLYDDGHWTDIGHYAPLIGPALHSKAGGVPMADIYCQYGLAPWLLIRAMFDLSDPAAGAAAIVVRLLNVAFFMTFVLIAFVVSQRKIRAMLLVMPMLLAGIAFHAGHLNLNGLPSTQGMRYLLPMLAAFLVALDPPRPWVVRSAVVILIAASFWSIETFLFTLMAWGGPKAVEAIRDRSAAAFFKRLAVAFALIAVAHLIFLLGLYIYSGRVADYIPYADIFIGFLIGRGNWPWPMAMKTEFLWWIPVWLAYFLTVALSLLGAMRREPRGITDRLLGVALVGIGALSYYVGRSSETTLGLSFLPFALIAICAYERVADSRAAPIGQRVATSGLLLAIFALVFAFGVERLSRELDVLKGNSTVLRRCFSPEGCSPMRVASRIRAATQMVVDYRYPPVPKLADMPVRVAELVGMLRSYAPDAARVAVLVEVDGESALTWFYGLMAFQQTGQWYRWQTSSPLNDALSPILARRIVGAAMVGDGDPLIIAKQEEKLIKLEQDILSKIRSACRLTKIGESESFAAFRAEECRWNPR
jgi:hypothetical protein